MPSFLSKRIAEKYVVIYIIGIFSSNSSGHVSGGSGSSSNSSSSISSSSDGGGRCGGEVMC